MSVHVSNSQSGFIGGTLLTIAVNLSPDDILRTMTLGIVGATTSYLVSKALHKGAVLLNRKQKKE